MSERESDGTHDGGGDGGSTDSDARSHDHEVPSDDRTRTHGHEHDHGTASTSNRKLAAVSIINLVGFVVELAGGLVFGSVALLSDAFHMLFDSLAYVMAFAATYAADRFGDDERWSYGLHRMEPFAALLNGLLLLPMIGFIVWESYQRFLDPVTIGTVPTLVIATGGLLVNVGSVYVLQGGEMSLNERGAFYHLVGDAGGSIAVIVSVLAIEVTGIRIIDPVTAGLIAVVVTWSAVKVLRGSMQIFFHRTPIELDAVRSAIESLDGVERVDDLHAWQVCSQLTVATTHVESSAETAEEAQSVIQHVHRTLEERGVDHATVELRSGRSDHQTRLDAHTH